MPRQPGLSVRVKLTLSYLALLLAAELLLFAVVWAFLLRYVPADAAAVSGFFFPGRDDLIRAFAPAAFWAVLASLAFGALGGWLLAGRMLAPLDRIAEATRDAARGSLSHRIELPGRQDEFRELADSFDSMLARLEDHVAQQRRFAANASHELRTPLALTQVMLEVARDDPGTVAEDLLARLHEVNARAIELTESLLLLSRAESRAFTSETVDLSLAAEQSVEILLPLAERQGVRLELEVETARASGSSSLLQQLITNLLHNAIVHNLPESGFVRLATAIEGDRCLVRVESSGDRLDPELISTMTEPFRRGTERVRDAQVGAGLGLAIVQHIVIAHEGVLTLEPRAGGGLVVSVRLPRGGGG